MAGPRPGGPKRGGGPGKPDRPKLKPATLAAARNVGATYEELDDPRFLGLLATVEAIVTATPARPIDAEVREALTRHRNRGAPGGPRKLQPATLSAAHAAGFTAAELNGERERTMMFTAEDLLAGDPSIDLVEHLRQAIAELRRLKTAEAAAATENGNRKGLELQANLLTAQAEHAKLANQRSSAAMATLDRVIGYVITGIVIAAIIAAGLYWFRYGKQ